MLNLCSHSSRHVFVQNNGGRLHSGVGISLLCSFDRGRDAIGAIHAYANQLEIHGVYTKFRKSRAARDAADSSRDSGYALAGRIPTVSLYRRVIMIGFDG